MHISRIEIKNFRNFKHVEFKLGPNAVIIGPNRVGKSNMLYALRLALDTSLPDSMRYLRTEDFWDGLKHPFHGQVISVVIEITDFDNNTEAKGLLCDALINSTPPFTARITYQFRPQATIRSAANAKEKDYTYIIFGGIRETQWISPDMRKMIFIMLLPALRDVESDLQSWRRSPIRPLLDRLKLSKKKVNAILRRLNSANNALLNEKPIRDLSAKLMAQLEEMVGTQQTTETQFGFASTRPDHLFRTVRLFVDGDKSRSLNDASLGTANILFLALLMQDMAELHQLKQLIMTVIAIEEPEAHIHPHVQRLIFQYFLRRKLPVILTTHSAHIASVTPLDAMVLLKATPNDGTIAHTVRNLNLNNADKADLERYLDVTRAEMLFATGVILVEGVAEQYLVPALATAMKNNLDRLGITVCSVSGTDFRPYHTLLSKDGFNIPYVVITDGDPFEKGNKKYFQGLKRGLSLLPHGSEYDQVKKYIDECNWRRARTELARFGIFVGDVTLEIDCLSHLTTLMKKTYADLIVSTHRQKRLERFTDLVNEAKKGIPDAAQTLLNEIDSIGKGRFAQRLADRVVQSKREGPPYITNAIRWIVNKVTS